MTAPSVLEKYVKLRPSGDAAPSETTDEPDDLGAFGWLRGMHDQALMLELRQKDGTVTALGYAWLERADFDPSEGITLKFAGTKVNITGRQLNGEQRTNVRLFAGIIRHRVPWIQEANGAQVMEPEKGATIIEAIKVQ
jgi:hypothetical protein